MGALADGTTQGLRAVSHSKAALSAIRPLRKGYPGPGEPDCLVQELSFARLPTNCEYSVES
jgi:hypothetical protein